MDGVINHDCIVLVRLCAQQLEKKYTDAAEES